MIRCPACTFRNSSDTYFCGKCRLYLHPIGDYTLLRLIGKGGFASVYEAIHRRTRKKAAVKILHRELIGRADVEQRFLREAKVLLELDSPQVVKLYDFGFCDVEDMGIYLVMEWCDGSTLRAAIDNLPQRRFSPYQARSLFSQLLLGLHHIHQKRVVHRDLKPSNLMLVEDKGDWVLKILDFGLAWVDEDTLTKTGTVVGSLRYMAPEQFRGDKEKYGPTTDLYSAGLILAWMLTGKHVFSGATVDILAIQHTLETAPSLHELCPDVDWPPALEELLARALAKEPEWRIPSALSFLEALNDVSLPGVTGSHLDLSSVSPYEETMAMGHSRTQKTSSLGWLLPLTLLLCAGLFIYFVAIAPKFPKPQDGGNLASQREGGQDGGVVPYPSSSRLEVVIQDGGAEIEQAQQVSPMVRLLMERWRRAWVALGEKPLSPRAKAAYRKFYHEKFFDAVSKRNKDDYTRAQWTLAQKSSWIRVSIQQLEVVKQSDSELAVKFHQIRMRSTIKTTGGPDADAVGSVYKEEGIRTMYWRKVGEHWQIKEVNSHPI